MSTAALQAHTIPDGAIEQLELEVASRLRPLALLGPDIVDHALERLMFDAATWVQRLTEPDPEPAAEGILEALWPTDPPPDEWWATPLGQLLATYNPAA